MSILPENPTSGKRIEDRARSLAASGLPTSEIADLLDVTIGTVVAWLRADEPSVGNRCGGRGGCGGIETVSHGERYGSVINQRMTQ